MIISISKLDLSEIISSELKTNPKSYFVNVFEHLDVTAREKILNLLAMREHSVFELRRKTKQSLLKSKIKNFHSLFERCIMEMQQKDFQSDERFTRNFINQFRFTKLTNLS